jgi:hypothetical protein
VSPGTLVTVAGREGLWRVVGQASYRDDDGRVVEHDWLRVVSDDEEVWVAPDDVTACEVRPMPLHFLRDRGEVA